MRLTTQDDGGLVIARVTGEIDLANSTELAAELARRISNRALGVIVDLSDVGYLDSSGVELLFDLKRRLDSRRQELRLVVPPDSMIRRVLETVQLDRTVAIDSTLDAAREAQAADKEP